MSAFNHADDEMRDKCARLQKCLSRDGVAGFFDEAVKLVVSRDFIAANADAIALSKHILHRGQYRPGAVGGRGWTGGI
jgi:hypothetical protein